MPPNYNCCYATHIDFKAFGATTAGCRSFILNVHVVKSMSLGIQSCWYLHRTQSALLKSLGVAPPTQACCIGLLSILWFFAFLRMACVKACGVASSRERLASFVHSARDSATLLLVCVNSSLIFPEAFVILLSHC